MGLDSEFERLRKDFLRYVHIERQLSPNTGRSYDQTLRQYAAFCLDHRKKGGQGNITIRSSARSIILRDQTHNTRRALVYP